MLRVPLKGVGPSSRFGANETYSSQSAQSGPNGSVEISRTKQQRGSETAATTPGPAACGEALQCKAEGISGDGDRRPANIIAPS